jgi:serine/threonine protein kinase
VGGISESYLARDLELERTIELCVARFEELNPWVLNEARVLASLQHPWIRPVYDIGLSSALRYFTTEYVPRSLAFELESHSIPLAKTRTAELFTKVAVALDHVHRRGYVHRDVKPFAILIDSAGEPRLSNFTIATVPNQRPEKDGYIVGTPAYMSPEQIVNGPIGPQTDVWGLGATLYEALCRQSPFDYLEGEIDDRLFFDRVLKAPPKDPRDIDSTIPDELTQICLRCLDKDPTTRYADCRSIARDLEMFTQAAPKRSSKQVFISHSSLDREFVEKNIVSVLESNGVPTWYSKASIQTAAEWERSILSGLKSCEWFLVVVSENSIYSEWVRDELFWAIEQRPDRIIPVRIDEREPRELHIRLARKQSIEISASSQDGICPLLSLLGAEMP